MKRFFIRAASFVLILTLVFSLSVTAFAAGEEPLVSPEAAEEAAPDVTEAPEEPPIEGDTGTALVPLPEEDVIIEEAAAVQQEEPAADAVSIDDILAVAASDAVRAAQMVNAIADAAQYEAALKAVLDLYYSGGSFDLLNTFAATLDGRAKDILLSYENAAAQRQSDDIPFAPGEIIAVFNSGVAEASAQSAAEEQGYMVARSMDNMLNKFAATVEIPLGKTVEQAVEEFSANPAVEYAQPNYRYEMAEAVAAPAAEDPDASFQWQHDKVNTAGAWSILNSMPAKSKVRVGVIDSSIEYTHSDLSANMAPYSDLGRFAGGNRYSYLTSGFDTHGTHVAGIIAGVSNNGIKGAGVGSGSNNSIVEIVGIDVFQGKYAYTNDIVNGLNFAVGKGCKVVNLSLGYVGPPDTYYESNINSAVSRGVTVVVAAGNDNITSGAYPSDFASTISVINTTNYASPTEYCKNYYSNYGANKDISAPGTNINSTVPGNGYGSLSGTSMASPLVAGVVGMMLYANPQLSPAQVRSILTGTATDLYTKGFDIYTAWGNVNAQAAVARAAGNISKDMPAPANFKAGVAAGSTDVNLTWSKIADTSNYTVAGYNIYRSTQKDSGYVHIADSTGTSYTDSDLAEGEAYFYKIAGFSEGTGGRKEGDLTGAVLAVVGRPFGAPGELTAKGQNIKEIKLEWSAVSEAEGYNIYRSAYQGYGYSLIKELAGGGSISYTDNAAALVPGNTYYYKVAAYRGAAASREESAAAGPVDAVAGTNELGVPQNFKAENIYTGSAMLTWERATAAQGYNIYRSVYEGYGYSLIKELAGGDSLSYKDSGLELGKTYYYKIAAYKGEGENLIEGQQTEPVELISREVLLGAPANVSAAGASTVKLSWNAVKYADGYEVYRADTETGQYSLIKTTTENGAVSYEDTAVIAGQTYYYKVNAYVKQGADILRGVQSNPVSVTVGGSVVDVPANFAAKSNAYNQIKLSWSAVTGANGYYVQVADSATGNFTLLNEIGAGGSVSLLHADVVTGKTYYYKIQAYKTVNGQKLAGKFSSVISGKAQVSKPADLKAEGVSTTSVKLTWTKAAGASGYYLYRSAAKDGTYKLITTIRAGGSQAYKDTTCPKPGTKYYYKLRPYRVVGGSEVGGSTAGPVAGQTNSNGVTGVRASCTSYNTLKVSWSKKTGATGYQVYTSRSANGTYTRVGSTSGSSLSIKVNPSTKYYIKVRHFVKKSGKVTYGGFSTVVSATTFYSDPNYYTGMSSYERPYETTFSMSIRNAGNKNMMIYNTEGVQARINDPYDPSNNVYLEMYDANGYKKSAVSVPPGQTVYLTFFNRYGFAYYRYTEVKFRMNYDGRAYECTASSQKSSYVRA